MTMSGPMISGMATTMMAVSRELVSASIVSAPRPFRMERSVIDRLTPAIACTSVVSVVNRDRTSPVRVTSKNVGSMRMTREYTLVRMSATTRSPSELTR